MLRSLSRWCRHLPFGMRALALLPIASLGFASSDFAVAQSSPVPYATPEQQYMIPFLQQHLEKTEGTSSNSGFSFGSNAAPIAQGTPYATTPNFGGYVNAPMYAARTSASLATGSTNNGVTTAITGDFNKDGKPDIAVLQQDGTLNILLNNGSGGLSAPVSYLNPNFSSASINQAYAVDLNGDGFPDVVAFDSLNDTTIVWLNLGNGQFNAAVTTAIDTTNGYPSMIYVADLNKDGKADLIFDTYKRLTSTSATITLEVQLGAGDGTFGAATAAKVQQFNIATNGTMPSIAGIALGDVNGDNNQDIAIVVDERPSSSTGAYYVTTALGNGDGTFKPLGVTVPLTTAIAGVGLRNIPPYVSSILSLTDVNGDGKADLVSDINGTVQVCLGNGDGSWQTAVTSSNSYVSGIASSVLLDVNGDGKLDLITAGGSMAVFLGNGDGTFATPAAGATYVTDPTSAQSLAVADFNADGKNDIAQLGSTYKQVSLFYNRGTGTLGGAPIVTYASDQRATYSSLLTSGKYTSNGLSSPLLSYSGGTTAQLVTNVNDGKGNFTSVTAMAYPTGLQYFEPIHADFNGDGLEDLVYASTTGGIYVALSNGDGTFKTPVSAGLPTTACPVYYGAAGDLNGDGKIDMVIPYGGSAACSTTSGGSGYYVLLGNGDGTFKAPTFTSAGTVLYSVALTDYNGDGKLDMILNDEPLNLGTGYQISTAAGNGDGTFKAPTVLLANYIAPNVVPADINNDGKIDLVISVQEVKGFTVATGGLMTILGNGDGTWSTPSMFADSNFFYGLQLADVNNDGNVDIVSSLYSTPAQPNTYYGMVTLLGYGNGQFAAPVNQLESLASSGSQVGNFYGDTAPDVMVSTGYGAALYVGAGGSTIALSPSASSLAFGQSETLTATVTAGTTGRAAATGAVSFYDGTTLIGSGTLSSGKATLTSASLATGSHTLKAVYGGDANYNPATSATASLTVTTLAPAFTLSGTPATVSVTGGSEGVVTLNLAANATFSGAVTLTCSGIPTNGTCAINPGSVTLAAGGTSTATLVIGTTANHASLKPMSAPWEAPVAGISLAAMFGVFFGRRKHVRSLGALSLAVLMSIGFSVVGCSGGGNDVTKSAVTVAPGTYTVTVTATPASGSTASTQTSTVNVSVN